MIRPQQRGFITMVPDNDESITRVNQEAAKTVIMACLQRGPQEVKELMLSAFEGSDEIN